jgi:S-(hydroxymethyl)glutathione dehydrogenase / alcohol dehydrogenase
MKFLNAAVLFSHNKPLEILSLEIPLLKEGQVLVKIDYSGVCRSQLMEFKGLRGEDKWLPHLLGHEASGQVVDIGKNVKKIKRYDEVILSWIKGNGFDAAPPKYRSGKFIINSGPITTFSNYSIVSENRVVRKPITLEKKHAALYGCAIPTGAGIVLNQLKPHKDQVILVCGLGGIGISAIFALKALGIKNIIAVDNNPKKLSYVRKFVKCTLNFNIGIKAIQNKIKKLFPSGVDAAIDSAGKIETIEFCFEILHQSKGKLYFASHPENNEKIKINPYDLICGKQIYGSWGGDIKPDHDFDNINSLFMKKNIPLDDMIKKIYRLNDINNALTDLDNGKVMRPIIKME